MTQYSENVKKHISVHDSESPALYVGTYGKYNEGSLFGAWLDLSTFADAEEFFEVCKELHKDERDPELMYQDFEHLPESLYEESMSAEAIQKVIDIASLDDDDKELVEDYSNFACLSFRDYGIDYLLDRARDAVFCAVDDFDEQIEELFFECHPEARDIQFYIDMNAVIRDYSFDFTFGNSYVFWDR